VVSASVFVSLSASLMAAFYRAPAPDQRTAFV